MPWRPDFQAAAVFDWVCSFNRTGDRSHIDRTVLSFFKKGGEVGGKRGSRLTGKAQVFDGTLAYKRLRSDVMALRDTRGGNEETSMKLADRIAKFEETDRVAHEIIDAEVIARETKTEKLRALRLAREKSGNASSN